MATVAERMESARKMGNGTMEMWVQFRTDEEVAEAIKWMKGKKKVKNLTPLTDVESQKRRDAQRVITAKQMGIK